MRKFHVPFRKNSGSMARERLKGVVLADRMNCSPEVIELIKHDITRVIEKYLDLDTANVEVHLDITSEAEQGVKNVKTIQIKGL